MQAHPERHSWTAAAGETPERLRSNERLASHLDGVQRMFLQDHCPHMAPALRKQWQGTTQHTTAHQHSGLCMALAQHRPALSLSQQYPV
jgi:hypothetical protein